MNAPALPRLVRVLGILGIGGVFTAGPGSALAQGTPERPRAGLAVWDTATPSAQPLTAEAVAKKDGWKLLPAGETAAPFRGDAVLSNGRVLAVARRQGTGVDLYSLSLGSPVWRARLVLTPGGDTRQIALTENGRGAAAVTVTSAAGAARFRLKKGDLAVEVRADADKAALRVECPGRFVALPDFFADDILFDARKLPSDRVELPSENFLLHFTGKQDAIVMAVFENRAQDVCVTLAGKGNARAVTGSEIDFGKRESKVWVAVLEGPGLWHTRDVTAADAGKVLPLDWKMPFPAQWRVDFTRRDGLTDSWDMLLPDKDGNGYVKPSWLAQDGRPSAATRTAAGEIDRDAYKAGGAASDRLGPDRWRWTTVLYRIQYPCWSDREHNGFLQPLKHRRLAFDGPVLVYPLTRLAETPVTHYTPVDVMRNTLGVGPCQHLLDIEGQKQEHVGRATCHVWNAVSEVYRSGRQKEKRKDVENYLRDGLDFVTHIRKRIVAYIAFGKELRTYLAEQRDAHPELKEQLDALAALAREIDERVEPRMQMLLDHKKVKEIAARLRERHEAVTPPALVAELNRNFIAKGLLDYQGPDWRAKLEREYAEPLVEIGDQQDESVGECRWVVKVLRQKAAVLLATDPRMALVAAEIRARTQRMLRGGAAYEGARH
jgi:hypothetical protein